MKALHSILVRDRTQYEKKMTKRLTGVPRAVNTSDISSFGRPSLFVNLK